MKTHTKMLSTLALMIVCAACSAGSQATVSPEPTLATPPAPVASPEVDPRALNWSWMETDELEERLERKETFVFVNVLEGCGNNPGALRKLDAFSWAGPFEHAERVPVYALWNTFDVDPDTLGPLTRAVYRQTRYGSPVMYFIRDGQLVDTSELMIYVGGFEKFMGRVALQTSLDEELEPRGSASELRRSLTWPNHVYRDMAGLNATGFTMKDPNFEGSDLRNADFTGATLDRPNFSHADLTGADLTQTTFTRPAFWGSCTCPDGTRSDDHGYTCEGHLAPARVEGIATDDAPSAKEKKTRAFIEALHAVE